MGFIVALIIQPDYINDTCACPCFCLCTPWPQPRLAGMVGADRAQPAGRHGQGMAVVIQQFVQPGCAARIGIIDKMPVILVETQFIIQNEKCLPGLGQG